MASDDKVIIGQTHGDDDPEAVLIGYLMAVEALRKDKQALMWLTKNGVYLATEGYAATVEVEDAPSIGDLHKEFVERGGTVYACPVCLRRPTTSPTRHSSTVPRPRAPRRCTSSPRAAPSR